MESGKTVLDYRNPGGDLVLKLVFESVNLCSPTNPSKLGPLRSQIQKCIVVTRVNFNKHIISGKNETSLFRVNLFFL